MHSKTSENCWKQMGFYRASIILETDDLCIVTHFCVIPGQQIAPPGQLKPLFGGPHLQAADTSTTGWEIWRRKQFTPQGSIIRAQVLNASAFHFQTNNCPNHFMLTMKNESEINAAATRFPCHVIILLFLFSKTSLSIICVYFSAEGAE